MTQTPPISAPHGRRHCFLAQTDIFLARHLVKVRGYPSENFRGKYVPKIFRLPLDSNSARERSKNADSLGNNAGGRVPKANPLVVQGRRDTAERVTRRGAPGGRAEPQLRQRPTGSAAAGPVTAGQASPDVARSEGVAG